MQSSPIDADASSSASFAPAWAELARLSPASLALQTERRFTCPAHVALLDDALLRAIGGEGPPRVIVEMPPRHGKSELISRFLPAWYLGTFPARRVLLCSYEAGFAASWGRRARDLLLEFGPQLFGARVREDARAAERFELERGGAMVSVGIGGPLMGRGADLLVIDDPLKNAEEARSERVRERHWEWFQSTAYSRLEPGAVVVVVMTRWHEHDLVGRLLSAQASGGERWVRVRLPALAEAADPLGRSEREALWPARYPRAALEQIRGVLSPYFWAALYQQRPSLIAVAPQGSKEARAHAIAPELEAGNVHLPAPAGVRPRFVEELIEECAAFPHGANDDQVDATTQALLRLAGRGARGDVRTGGYDPRIFEDR